MGAASEAGGRGLRGGGAARPQALGAVYLDHRQHASPEEPVPIGYVRILEDFYRFEPVTPELSPEQAAHVLGIQATGRTEVMDSQQRLDHQVFPRPAAFAEVAWSRLPHWPSATTRTSPGGWPSTGYPLRPTRRPRRRLPPARRPLPWQKRPGVLGRPIDGAPPNV